MWGKWRAVFELNLKTEDHCEFTAFPYEYFAHSSGYLLKTIKMNTENFWRELSCPRQMRQTIGASVTACISSEPLNVFQKDLKKAWKFSTDYKTGKLQVSCDKGGLLRPVSWF